MPPKILRIEQLLELQPIKQIIIFPLYPYTSHYIKIHPLAAATNSSMWEDSDSSLDKWFYVVYIMLQRGQTDTRWLNHECTDYFRPIDILLINEPSAPVGSLEKYMRAFLQLNEYKTLLYDDMHRSGAHARRNDRGLVSFIGRPLEPKTFNLHALKNRSIVYEFMKIVYYLYGCDESDKLICWDIVSYIMGFIKGAPPLFNTPI